MAEWALVDPVWIAALLPKKCTENSRVHAVIRSSLAVSAIGIANIVRVLPLLTANYYGEIKFYLLTAARMLYRVSEGARNFFSLPFSFSTFVILRAAIIVSIAIANTMKKEELALHCT